LERLKTIEEMSDAGQLYDNIIEDDGSVERNFTVDHGLELSGVVIGFEHGDIFMRSKRICTCPHPPPPPLSM